MNFKFVIVLSNKFFFGLRCRQGRNKNKHQFIMHGLRCVVQSGTVGHQLIYRPECNNIIGRLSCGEDACRDSSTERVKFKFKLNSTKALVQALLFQGWGNTTGNVSRSSFLWSPAHQSAVYYFRFPVGRRSAHLLSHEKKIKFPTSVPLRRQAPPLYQAATSVLIGGGSPTTALTRQFLHFWASFHFVFVLRTSCTVSLSFAVCGNFLCSIPWFSV